MPEGSVDATILLATSWQALTRAKSGDERTMICNCTIVVVFAAFFIEANLNHIIEKMGKTMKSFNSWVTPTLVYNISWHGFIIALLQDQKPRIRGKCIRTELIEKSGEDFPAFMRFTNLGITYLMASLIDTPQT